MPLTCCFRRGGAANASRASRPGQSLPLCASLELAVIRAVTRAQDMPSRIPAIASDSQWAAEVGAGEPHQDRERHRGRAPQARRLPGGTRAMTAATTVTDAATAWPDGNDAPLVATSDPGGLARS